jgi:hypothetical protein
MNPAIYYSVTLLLYAVETLLAIFFTVWKIGTSQIFGIIGLFAGNGLSYFIPSLFVIIGFKKFGDKKFMDENGKWVTVAWINFFGGVFFFCLFGYATVAGMLSTPITYHGKGGVVLTPC